MSTLSPSSRLSPTLIRSLFGDDRRGLPPAVGRGGDPRLKRAAEFRENERREIVEVLRAEGDLAGREPVRADRQRAGQTRRREAQGPDRRSPIRRRAPLATWPEPASGWPSMSPVSEALASSSPVRWLASSRQRDAGRLAVEQPAGAERGLHLGAEVVGRAGQARDERGLAVDPRIDGLRLRDLDRGADVGLAAADSRRRASPSRCGRRRRDWRSRSRRPASCARRRSPPSSPPSRLVEDRVGRDELRRMRVDRRAARGRSRARRRDRPRGALRPRACRPQVRRSGRGRSR